MRVCLCVYVCERHLMMLSRVVIRHRHTHTTTRVTHISSWCLHIGSTATSSYAVDAGPTTSQVVVAVVQLVVQVVVVVVQLVVQVVVMVQMVVVLVSVQTVVVHGNGT